MSARIAKLEGLLERIQTRAAEPRMQASANADEVEDVELDEPGSEESSGLEMGKTDVFEDEVDVIEEVELDEPGVPESGQVTSATMDDAIEAAEHQPPLTPPPESGEGVASPQIPPQGGPTMAQLGETISLDEGARDSIELDEPALDSSDLKEASRDMEPDGGAAPVSGAVQVPEDAQQELDRVRLGEATPIEALVSSRPAVSTSVVELVSASRTFEPKSFLDLVDASLALK